MSWIYMETAEVFTLLKLIFIYITINTIFSINSISRSQRSPPISKGKQWIFNLLFHGRLHSVLIVCSPPTVFTSPPKGGAQGSKMFFFSIRRLPAVFRNHSQRGGTRCISATQKKEKKKYVVWRRIFLFFPLGIVWP